MNNPSEQKIIIEQVFLEETDILARLDFAYCLSKDWWQSWCRFVGFNQERSGEAPGPITNEALLSDESYSDAIESSSVLITTTVWSRLKDWYKGGPDLKVYISDCKADYSPIRVSVSESLLEPGKPYWVSLQMYVTDLEKYLCQEMYIPVHKATLSLLAGEFLVNISDKKTSKLGKAGIRHGSALILEQRKDKIKRSSSFDRKNGGRKSPGNKSDTNHNYAVDRFEVFDADFDLWGETTVRTDTEQVRDQVRQALGAKKVRPRVKKLARTCELYYSMVKELRTKQVD